MATVTVTVTAHLENADQSGIFVDDTELNCRAAEELGMRAILFETDDQAVTELDALMG